MGSPGDFAIEMKKRKKMARLQQQKVVEPEEPQAAQEPVKPVQQQTAAEQKSVMSLASCDLGASPTLQPKSFKVKMSPLMHARNLALRDNRNKK